MRSLQAWSRLFCEAEPSAVEHSKRLAGVGQTRLVRCSKGRPGPGQFECVSRVFTRNDWLESRASLTFLAKCTPRLCARHRDWGMGAGAPTGLRPGACTRVRAVPQAVQAAVRDAQRHYVQSLLRALRGSVGEG